ncbi:MAG: amidohydrolase family protein [Elusimicrobia bacterium]|nr:amidohydrolase family protein [Elusimicrobiota bacterium]
MTDVHVHLAALPTPGNGCLVSRKMREGPLGRLICRMQGLSPSDPEGSNRRYVENLLAELAASRHVDKAVLLGMDGVYGADGRLDEGATEFLISNDCVFDACAGRERLLPGPSINPARRDAVDELERCAAKGAVLVKVLPNAQGFDPAEPRFRPFYKALARLGIPLLGHVGHEFSLVGRDQSVGDLGRLVAALEEGVTVIAAHGCSSGLVVVERHLPLMLDLVRRFEDFFVDTSALTLPNRVGALFRLARHPEVFERLLFGTDYPLHVFAYPCLGALAAKGYVRALTAATRFDRQFEVLAAVGVRLTTDFESLRRPR